MKKIFLAVIVAGALAFAPIKSSEANPVILGVVVVGVGVYVGYLVAGTIAADIGVKKVHDQLEQVEPIGGV